MIKINNIILHHSGGTDSDPMADSSNYTLEMCERDHKRRFPNMRSSLGYYCGYHYFIDKKGKVTQTRQDWEEGAHCVGYNNHPGDDPSKSAIGIHLSGNFDATLPVDEQKRALKPLLLRKMAEYSLPASKIQPHRKFAHKTCFGNRLPDNWGEKLVEVITEGDRTKVKDMAEAKAFKYLFSKPIKMGQSGEEVRKLQIALCITGDLDIMKFELGGYGTRTASAVYKFQTRNKVAPVQELNALKGESVGPATRSALNKLFNK